MYNIYTILYSLKNITVETSDSLLHNTFINYHHQTTHETDEFSVIFKHLTGNAIIIYLILFVLLD